MREIDCFTGKNFNLFSPFCILLLLYLSHKLLIMKKIIGLFVLLTGALINIPLQAQSYNSRSLGVSTGYMFDTEHIQGGIFLHLPFAKNWRVTPSVNYAFSHRDRNEWEINGDIHYLIPFAGRFAAYPLAGIAFQSWRGDALQNNKELSSTRNKFGINAGAGFEMNISSRLNLRIEGKYIFIKDFNQANLSIGLGYNF